MIIGFLRKIILVVKIFVSRFAVYGGVYIIVSMDVWLIGFVRDDIGIYRAF